MKKIHFKVPRDCNLAFAEQWIETACNRQRLDLAMKGTLATYPGSTHWHYRKPGQKGTLELTLFIPDRRIWAKIQDGRRARWINATLPSLRKTIEQQLRSKPQT
ncbi:MAG TPA: hypothetical protein VK685_02470 [Candidatus Acidoferrum sp.]|nr:hypothetical protein [Candidatus Acidoferrum sp.]